MVSAQLTRTDVLLLSTSTYVACAKQRGRWIRPAARTDNPFEAIYLVLLAVLSLTLAAMKFAAAALCIAAPACAFVNIAAPVAPAQTGVMRMVQERSTAIPFDKRPENLDGE
jgi:hypothetical protein